MCCAALRVWKVLSKQNLLMGSESLMMRRRIIHVNNGSLFVSAQNLLFGKIAITQPAMTQCVPAASWGKSVKNWIREWFWMMYSNRSVHNLHSSGPPSKRKCALCLSKVQKIAIRHWHHLHERTHCKSQRIRSFQVRFGSVRNSSMPNNVFKLIKYANCR